MSKQLSLWDVDDRLEEISAAGDPLEHLAARVDLERFRLTPEKADVAMTNMPYNIGRLHLIALIAWRPHEAGKPKQASILK